MEALVLNTEFQAVGVVDVFESFIWTDRYSSYGDFELYTHPSRELIDLMQHDYYLYNERSEHIMIIETSKIESDLENGNHITFSGRSLESLLTRRIVWEFTELGHTKTEDDDQEEYEENFQNGIRKLLAMNCLDADEDPHLLDYSSTSTSGSETCDENRVIQNLFFEPSTDPRITGLTIKAQIPAGSNLYEVIKSLCDEKGCGFKITLDKYNQFIFTLYMGEDRSYDQDTNPYVVFSPELDNLLNSNYVKSYIEYKNAALVIGDDDGDDQRQAFVSSDDAVGIDRREIFVDGSSMSWEDEEGNYYEPEEYDEQLAQMGREALSDSGTIQSFEGEAEYRRTYEYKKDFFIGDIVQLENEYGITAISRITEIVFSHDGSGENTIPTFSSVERNYGSYSVSSGSTGRITTSKQIEDAINNVQYSLKANEVQVTKLDVDGISSYKLVVYRMAGIAVVTLEVSISASGGFGNWTKIATDLPPAATTWYDTMTTWNNSFKQNVRVRVTTSGDLEIHYGSNTVYRISFSYPLIGGGSDEGGGGGGGGGTGTSNYNELINKPRIEDVTLVGNQTFEELGLEVLSNMEIEELLV